MLGEENTAIIPRMSKRDNLAIERYLRFCLSSSTETRGLCLSTNCCRDMMQFSSHSIYPQVVSLKDPAQKPVSKGGMFLSAVFTRLLEYTSSAASVNWSSYLGSKVSPPFSEEEPQRLNQPSSHPDPCEYSRTCLCIFGSYPLPTRQGGISENSTSTRGVDPFRVRLSILLSLRVTPYPWLPLNWSRRSRLVTGHAFSECTHWSVEEHLNPLSHLEEPRLIK